MTEAKVEEISGDLEEMMTLRNVNFVFSYSINPYKPEDYGPNDPYDSD